MILTLTTLSENFGVMTITSRLLNFFANFKKMKNSSMTLLNKKTKTYETYPTIQTLRTKTLYLKS